MVARSVVHAHDDGPWWERLGAPSTRDLLIRLARLGDPHDHATALPNAVGFARLLTQIAEEIVEHHVASARWGRLSWETIGDLLGVSRQAASARFAHARRHVVVVDDDQFKDARDRHAARFDDRSQ